MRTKPPWPLVLWHVQSGSPAPTINRHRACRFPDTLSKTYHHCCTNPSRSRHLDYDLPHLPFACGIHEAGQIFCLLQTLDFTKKDRGLVAQTGQVKLIKTGAKVVRHSRYVIFKMAEVAAPRDLFLEILQRIRLLALVPIPVGVG